MACLSLASLSIVHLATRGMLSPWNRRTVRQNQRLSYIIMYSARKQQDSFGHAICTCLRLSAASTHRLSLNVINRLNALRAPTGNRMDIPPEPCAA